MLPRCLQAREKFSNVSENETSKNEDGGDGEEDSNEDSVVFSDMASHNLTN